MKLQELKLRTVRLPLIRPYVLSYRTFTEFEPIIVVRDGDGRVGWGDGHISPWLQPRDEGRRLVILLRACHSRRRQRHEGGQVHCRRIQRILETEARLFAEPLRFAAGELVLAAGYTPTIDADVLATHELGQRANSSREKH